jgi:hypothetical protein
VLRVTRGKFYRRLNRRDEDESLSIVARLSRVNVRDLSLFCFDNDKETRHRAQHIFLHLSRSVTFWRFHRAVLIAHHPIGYTKANVNGIRLQQVTA